MKKTPVLGFAFVAILLLLGCSSDEISAQNESRVENISKSDKALVKRLKIFREEFLKITPGKTTFRSRLPSRTQIPKRLGTLS